MNEFNAQQATAIAISPVPGDLHVTNAGETIATVSVAPPLQSTIAAISHQPTVREGSLAVALVFAAIALRKLDRFLDGLHTTSKSSAQ